jgi:hypothetical protein
MTDFRALCAELLKPLAEQVGADPHHVYLDLVTRTRLALAQPEPQGPTDKELCEFYRSAYYACENRQGPTAQAYALRAVLERWGCQ